VAVERLVLQRRHRCNSRASLATACRQRKRRKQNQFPTPHPRFPRARFSNY
jgi:hypothetical protein